MQKVRESENEVNMAKAVAASVEVVGARCRALVMAEDGTIRTVRFKDNGREPNRAWGMHLIERKKAS